MAKRTLYAELKLVREKLIEEKKCNDKNSICSDNILQVIAKVMPTNKTDLLKIPSLSPDFVSDYGKEFIECVVDYTKKNNISISKDSSLVNTLKELEKKLVNLNRRNRLLYSNSLASKYGIDLLSLMDKDSIYKFIFNKHVKAVKLCDLTVENTNQLKYNERFYNKLVGLSREANRELREKGQYDLFIALPFLRGKLLGEDFQINAPLVLFPVSLAKENTHFVLKKDATRDIVYNNNILLANYKFNKINKPLPNNVVVELDEKDFYKDIAKFYKAEKIDIIYNNMDLSPYIQPSESKKSYRKGELEIIGNAVLGKYSTYSSSMQKDLNSIINSGVINSLLEDLLSGMDDYDFYSDSTSDFDLKSVVKEGDIRYINAINSTQESVISASDNCKELVIEGPPGTGKSQVITSLIANAVSKNRSILMVSEKKSALDVVYSRLGELSKYVLLLDDVNNKDIFYNQIDLLTRVESANQEVVPCDEVERDIDECIESMDAISKKMCDKSRYGIEVYKLYSITNRWNLEDKEKACQYEVINRCVDSSVKSLKYNELRKIYLIFKNSNLLNSLAEYKTASIKYPQLFNFKSDISQVQLAKMYADCEQLVGSKNILENLKISHKHCVKRALRRQAKAWFKFAYNKGSSYDTNDFLENTQNYSLMTKKYDAFIKNKQAYDELNSYEKKYFDSIYCIAEELNYNLSIASDMIYKYIINKYILDFENDNKLILNKIDDYSNALYRISTLLQAKIDITKDNLAIAFSGDMQKLINSNRIGEIRRMIESNRRWSVSKFVDKFFRELFMSIKVWLLTPEVVSEILPLKPELFDLVIFDEASQLYIEKGIPAILRAKAVIIAGDSKQLRPSNLGSGRLDYNHEELLDDIMKEDSGVAALEEESLLDVARFKYPPIMLDFHYRSKYSELIAFSNYAFYGGKLNVSPNPIPPQNPPIKVIKVKDGLWENRANLAEARAVVDNLRSFLRTRKNNETVGIITFNSAQRDLIMDIIDEVSRKDKTFANRVNKEFLRKENGEDIGLFVKNIENVQGDERDYIIFSIGYAQNEQGKVVKNFGWLSQRGGENRLNVAISRAKMQVVIVSSIDPQDLDASNCKNRGPYILRKYLEYATCVSKGDKVGANNILLSFVEKDKSIQYEKNRPIIANDVKNELEAHGYEIEENIGVGAYTIDMAVKYEGRYVLGIEFDSSLYNVNVSNRERDYHRWKYFKLRGWEIHRIWCSRWWNDKNGEINKILTRLKKIVQNVS